MALGKIGEGAVSNEPSERGNPGRKERVVFVRDIFEKPETEKKQKCLRGNYLCFHFEL